MAKSCITLAKMLFFTDAKILVIRKANIITEKKF